MTITCVIRYQIDPFQRDGFKKYAENLGVHHSSMRRPPLCGYFLPMKVRMMWPGLIAFDSLAVL